MPTDLKSMLRAADSHDALVSIEHRDLPSMIPPHHEVRAIAERIVAEANRRAARLGEPGLSSYAGDSLRDDIVMALLDVRFVSAEHAARKTWDAIWRIRAEENAR